jgi:N-methylhydantoinase B
MKGQLGDPFTREIIRESLVAAAEESFMTLGRASKSTIIYEVLDYACGITDLSGDLIAQANGVPGFLGLLTFAVKDAIRKYGRDGFADGDIFISNDPYTSGTHLSDVSMCMPIFAGRDLFGFAVNKAHWTEVGGKDPGSWTTDSTEIFQEGIQFPNVKLCKGSVLDETLIDLIRANVRVPEMTLGDLHAQAASLRVARHRVQEVCDRYGRSSVEDAVAWLLVASEQKARRGLKTLPQGTFEAADWIDGDGLTDEPIQVRVQVTIAGDSCVIDYSGSSPQVKGPVNCTLPATVCAARKVFLSVVDPHMPVNEGCFRPLRVVVPEGTVFHALRPAPTAIYWDSMIFAEDLVCKALAPHVPERMTAGHFLSTCGLVLATRRANGTSAILVEPQAGGWGASRTKDGERGLVASSDGDTCMIPIEVCEQRYPIRVERYAFNVEEGGEGEFRGGNGLVRDYRILGEGAAFTATFGRFRFPPWGMAGGRPGTCNRAELYMGGAGPIQRGKVARVQLRAGDRIRLVTGTGGGYGDPLRRDPYRVLEDIRNGFLSPDQARRLYGVAVVSDKIDPEQTEQLRALPRPHGTVKPEGAA